MLKTGVMGGVVAMKLHKAKAVVSSNFGQLLALLWLSAPFSSNVA